MLRLANQILQHFQAQGLVYIGKKNQENPPAQTRDIVDVVRLCIFQPAQCNFYTVQVFACKPIIWLLECFMQSFKYCMGHIYILFFNEGARR